MSRRDKHGRRPPRRWWQRCIRAALCVALLLVGVYVTLPWWAPTRLIADALAKKLSGQMSVPVRIDSLSLSWSGVRIRGLAVDPPPGFDRRAIMRIDELRAEFSPLNLLWRGRLEWVEIDKPTVFAQVHDDGRVNLAPLTKLPLEPEVGRVSVHQAVVLLKVPDQRHVLSLAIGDFQWVSGRGNRIGRMTMSASLPQTAPAAPAPVNLAAGPDPEAKAKAEFNFNNVDLAQLPLVSLLGLNLRELAGRCDGSLSVRLNQSGEVDRFSCALGIRGLHVRPAVGRPLKVVAKAGLDISAELDWIAQKANIRSFRIRLPGLDVGGKAEVFSEILEGNLEAVRSCRLVGTVRPVDLASLLPGRAELPAGINVAGPLELDVQVDRDGPVVGVKLAVDATSAAVKHHRVMLKPAGRKLTVNLNAVLDDRTWRCDVAEDNLKASLGGNTFTGFVRIPDLRRLLERPTGPEPARPSREVLEALAGIEGTVRWELRDLAALADVLAPAIDLPDGAALAGCITGRCSLTSAGGSRTHMELKLLVPSEARLSLGRNVVKPGKAGARLDLSGLLDGAGAGMTDGDIELTVGAGRADLRNMTATFAPSAGSAGGEQIRFATSCRLSRIEELLKCLPNRPGGEDLVLAGGMSGRFAATFGGKLRQARAHLDLTGMRIQAGDRFVKPAAELTQADIDFVSGGDKATDGEARINFLCTHQAGKARGVLLARGQGLTEMLSAGRIETQVSIDDPRRAAGLVPLVSSRLDGVRLDGTASVSLAAHWTADGELTGRIALDAADLLAERTDAAGKTRRKRRKVPAAVDVYLRAQRDVAGRFSPRFATLEAVLGRSSVFATAMGRHRGKGEPFAAGVDEFRGRIEVGIDVDKALKDVLPEVASLCEKHGLGGRAGLTAWIGGRQRTITFDGKLDATATVLERVEAFEAALPRGEGRTIRIGPFAKPADLPATVSLAASAERDLTSLNVRKLRVDLGDVHLQAAGSVALRAGEDRWFVAPRGGKAPTLSLWTERAKTLGLLLPGLKPYRLGGAARADLTWHQRRRRCLRRVALSFHKVTGRFRRKDLLADGQVLLTDVWIAPHAAGVSAVGGATTDGLEFRIGKNHGWVMAEVADVLTRPTGSVHLLAQYMDDKDIQDWLVRPAEPPPTEKLTDSQIEALRSRGAEYARQIKSRLAGAKLELRADIEQFGTYDPAVAIHYLARSVALRATVDGGRITGRYAAGINGGLIVNKYEIRLDAETPTVACEKKTRDVIARDNIQPQLALYFPGNTVHGFFNQTASIQYPLRELLANSIEPRYPLYPVGRGKTITIRGVTRGRAAPRPIATIFPGLNLAEYHYRKMTSFADYMPNGTAENDMVFDGSVYDLYIKGKTDADHMGEYELGLILLGTPQTAEWNHTWQLGRLPILKIKARIEGGKLHDEEVSYPWPHEPLSIIYNPVYQAWVQASKQPPPSDKSPKDGNGLK